MWAAPSGRHSSPNALPVSVPHSHSLTSASCSSLRTLPYVTAILPWPGRQEGRRPVAGSVAGSPLSYSGRKNMHFTLETLLHAVKPTLVKSTLIHILLGT